MSAFYSESWRAVQGYYSFPEFYNYRGEREVETRDINLGFRGVRRKAQRVVCVAGGAYLHSQNDLHSLRRANGSKKKPYWFLGLRGAREI